MQDLKQRQIEEERRRQKSEKHLQDNLPQASKHNEEKELHSSSEPQTNSCPKFFSSSNPFLNDMLGKEILTPQKYTNGEKKFLQFFFVDDYN